MAPLVIGAIGVVYGDIGTSPLYTLRQCFTGDASGCRSTPGERARHPVDHLLGADDHRHAQVRDADHARRQPRRRRHPGADGARLARTRAITTRRRWWLVGFGIFGAAMFYGDGMITPAISVLGAVEGLEIIAPGAAPVRRARDAGDHRRAVRDPEARHRERRQPVRAGDVRLVRRARAARACSRSSRNPACCARSIRCYALAFVVDSPRLAFLALGAVVLAVTGTEALYADMGHFGASPIRRAWLAVRDAGARAQLFRPGRAAARRPRGDQESVLPAGAAVGADSAGRPRDLRGGHRVAGGHLRRVLADARGDPDGLLPAPQDPAHVRAPDRPDLRPVHQLDAADRGGRCWCSASGAPTTSAAPTASR